MAGIGSAFREGFVQADGFRIRYMEAGDGPPLVHLHGSAGVWLTPAHDLLARQFRVIAFEMPGFGAEENSRTSDNQAMAVTMAAAAEALGLDRYHVMGTSFGARIALWFAVQQAERVGALVLDAPSAIRPDGAAPVAARPEEFARRLYAHPERMPPVPPTDPLLAARRSALVSRLRGPARDTALEGVLPGLKVPVLVVFGTRDTVIPPEMGRIYQSLMPDAHLAFVYDAGHAVTMERPDAFSEIVADFLERDEAFMISRTRTVILP
ncbi:MAG: alpha/beta hydrolase [Acetobacteraceae bacterium]|nr:alpha/beta hydrolase [Acetobacteraceae bacterium]